MKNRNTVFSAIPVAIAFALLPVVQAAPRPDGGPVHIATSKQVNGNEAGAQLGMSEDILPIVSISFAPVGLTLGQTARLNLVNVDVANGITVNCRFIDASGITLANSVTTLTMGKTTSVDFKRNDNPPADSPGPLRIEVRAQVDIFTSGVSSDSLRRSLEVFSNDSGATTVYMAGGS